MTAMQTPLPLDRLRAALSGEYAIDREFGRGGMATVYLARDLTDREARVAVRVLATYKPGRSDRPTLSRELSLLT